MGMADEQAPNARAEKHIRALCVGGSLDGQWKAIPSRLRYGYDVPRAMNLTRMVTVQEKADLSVGFPEFDRYRVVGPIVMFGQGPGICLALERDALFEKYRGSEERMILSAILQRDVATEMGL